MLVNEIHALKGEIDGYKSLIGCTVFNKKILSPQDMYKTRFLFNLNCTDVIKN